VIFYLFLVDSFLYKVVKRDSNDIEARNLDSIVFIDPEKISKFRYITAIRLLKNFYNFSTVGISPARIINKSNDLNPFLALLRLFTS
jgi:hypothetical protein